MASVPVLAASSGSFLVSPNVGLMVWTLLLFGISVFALKKYAFPRITEALDKRQHAIEDSIDHAERVRTEADQLLAEYRERLKEARGQAEEIVSRARKTAEVHEREAEAEAKAKREQMMEQTRRDIEAETRRSIQEIRREVADLTVMATEKVTRKTLTEEDQRRLVQDALSELDFSALSWPRITGNEMEEIARVYARALFEVAVEHDALDEVREQLDAFADAMHENRDLAVFFFSPYFSVPEKKDGLKRAVQDANPAVINFLEALIERHRMPAIFRIRTDFDAMWEEARHRLPVHVTSAIKLDGSVVDSLGKRIGEQTDREVVVSSEVDPDILGGVVLRVGNVILDASIKNRLEQLRKQVAQA